MGASSTGNDGALYRAFRRTVIAKIERDLAAERLAATKVLELTMPRVRSSVGEARRQRLCTRAWLFGSFAWGQPTGRSDIDLLLADCLDPDTVAVMVGHVVGRPVHVLKLEEAPASLVERALRDGVPI
ncbi:MAG: nucleotidyltransferase domain-containing protein [Clostridia bacterium]|nr:nucleotidyltransferase domain-containing protein [Deltaproteobacteria bacterium]